MFSRQKITESHTYVLNLLCIFTFIFYCAFICTVSGCAVMLLAMHIPYIGKYLSGTFLSGVTLVLCVVIYILNNVASLTHAIK